MESEVTEKEKTTAPCFTPELIKKLAEESHRRWERAEVEMRPFFTLTESELNLVLK